MILAAALLVQAAAAPPPASTGATVVVTGHPVDDAKAALAACLARACPPADEIAAATALSVAQFLAGDYLAARDTAGHAAGRNRRYARTLPVPVSDLLALQGALATLTGVIDTGRIRRIDAVSALRVGLAPSDQRIAFARIAVADAFAAQGDFYDAIHQYDAVARRAAAMGQKAAQGRAMFAGAMLYAMAAGVDGRFRDEATRRAAALNATTDPALAPYREATLALRGRMASRHGDERELARVLADAAKARAHEALLVYEPPIDLEARGVGLAQAPTEGQWITIGYRVAPDGTVHDVTVVKEPAHVSPTWTEAVLASVAKRRYLALDLPADAPGLARTERASLVSDVAGTIRTRVRTHVGPPRIAFTDLTPAGRTTAP